MLNLDTHVLVHALGDELTVAEGRLLASDAWSISAIVLWEIAMLAARKRLRIDIDSDEIDQTLAKIHVWPIDRNVVRASVRLDFRSDPADELIAATSVVHAVPLVTRDRKLLRSKVVPLAVMRA